MPDDQGQYGYPARPPEVPGFPENQGILVFEKFETLNTKPPRPAIQDGEMFWCDGWMPIGPSNLRTLPDIGSGIYTAPSGTHIVAFWFYNFSATTYMAVLLTNGSMLQVVQSTGATTTIMPAGTIQIPDSADVGVSQWNSKYLIIVANQTNGFWMWDGSLLYGPGGIAPEVEITNAGQNYASQPTLNTITTATSFTPPTFNVTLENGFVTDMNATSPGSGFAVDDFVALAFQGGGTDTTALLHVTISANTGPVIDVVVTDPGANYEASAFFEFSGGGGTGVQAVPAFQGTQSLSIPGATILDGGTGYNAPPDIKITGGGGHDFAAFTRVGYGEITGIPVLNPGSGYKSSPTVTILGDGQDAQAEAQINVAGQVTGITVTKGGFGYTKAIAVLSGGNDAAEASIHLMPFGVQGTTVEIYQNRTWVGNLRKAFFSAPSTASDFTPSNGAGVFQSNDSFQRVAYHCFKQTNGFLYLISDSSINYVGGVQTTTPSGSSSVQTVFSNINVDPQIGTPWPSTVQLFSRNIVFANSFGIFVSYGGAVTKISTPLDGIYNSVVPSGTTPSVFPSSAVASIFGIQVYMLLFPVIDTYTGQIANKLLIWDGKRWFTSDQSVSLSYVTTQEVNSFLTAWGTDGSKIYPLFQNPSSLFQKVVQSRLWSNPNYWFTKSTVWVAGITNFYNTVGTISLTIDSESGSSIPVSIQATSSIIWTNNSGQLILWKNASNQPIVWGALGLGLFGPEEAAKAGVLMGMTLVTTAPDVALLSASVMEQNYTARI